VTGNVTGNVTGTVDNLQLDANGSGAVEMIPAVILMANLPTSDPTNAGQLWNSSGTLKISAG
jgi:hypothetical protein